VVFSTTVKVLSNNTNKSLNFILDVVVLDEGTIVSPTLIELIRDDPQTVADYGLILQNISLSKLTNYLGNNFQGAHIIENPKDLNGSVIEIDYEDDHIS
jgi:hypothetical protein